MISTRQYYTDCNASVPMRWEDACFYINRLRFMKARYAQQAKAMGMTKKEYGLYLIKKIQVQKHARINAIREELKQEKLKK